MSRNRIHCCLFDRSCWQDGRRYGMPLRLYVGERFWTIIPGRIWRMWEQESEPVEVAKAREDMNFYANPENIQTTGRVVRRSGSRRTRSAKCPHLSITGSLTQASCNICGPLPLKAV